MKNKTYSGSIANAINSFLTEDDWNFSFDDHHGLFNFSLSLKGRIKQVNYVIRVKDDEYIVYAISPIGADNDDEKMMTAMAEFICRANYGLGNGNFELDMGRRAEIRYKCFVDCEGVTPTMEMVRNSIYCPARMFDRYGAGIVDIIFGNATAKDAIAKCEKSSIAELRAILGEEVGEDENLGAMIARLASRFGADESVLRAGSEQAESENGEIGIRTDLFGAEGGVA